MTLVEPASRFAFPVRNQGCEGLMLIALSGPCVACRCWFDVLSPVCSSGRLWSPISMD